MALHYSISREDMGNLSHVVLAKFKEGVVVEDIAKEMEKLVLENDSVEYFVWGKDDMNTAEYRNNFTYAFLMAFKSKEDYVAFCGSKKHKEFETIFKASIENAMMFDFPTITVKAPPPPPPPAAHAS